MRGVAEIVGICAACQARAGGWLARNHTRLRSAAQPGANKRERNAGKVAAATCTAHDNIRIISRHLKLSDRLLAAHSLVQQDVVEDAAERISRNDVLCG